MGKALGLLALLWVGVASPLLAKEPEKLTELRGIFEKARASALAPLAPLAGNYIKALERERKVAMQSDDLDSALSYAKEQKQTKDLLDEFTKALNSEKQPELASKAETKDEKPEEKKEKEMSLDWNRRIPSVGGHAVYFEGSKQVYVMQTGSILRVSLASGKTIRSLEMPLNGTYTFCGCNDNNIAVAFEGTVSVIRASLSRQVWSLKISEAKLQSLTFDNAKLLIGADEAGKIICVDLEERKVKWTYQTKGLSTEGDARRWLITPPVIDGRRFVYFATNRTAYCLDLEQGMAVWETELPGYYISVSPGCIDDANVYFIDSWGNRLFCLSSLDGENLWTFNLGNNYYRWALLNSSDQLFSGSGDWGKIFGINTKNGKELWQAFPAGGAALLGMSRFGEPFAGNQLGKIMLLHPASGKEIAKWDLRKGPVKPRTNGSKQLREEKPRSIIPVLDSSYLVVHSMGIALFNWKNTFKGSALWGTQRGSPTQSGKVLN